MLARGEGIPRYRKMSRLRRRGYADGLDLVHPEQLAVIADRRSRPGRLRHFGEAFRTDLGQMEAPGQRMGRASLRADAAAPAGPDDRYADLSHAASFDGRFSR